MAGFALLLIIPLTANIQITQSNSWYGSKFECVGRNKCYDDQIHCEDNKHCKIDCNGPNACQYAAIHCPKAAKCEVKCVNGIDACKDVIFLAESSSSLSISCDRSQDEACDETVIYCPNNGRSGPNTCKVSGVSQINVKTKMEIFAVEGLNDVEITGTYVNNAFLYCGLQYSSTCTLTDTSPFRHCISNDKTCENYLLPTLYPTLYPTSHPTLDPTDFPTDQPTPQPTHDTLQPTYHPTIYAGAITTSPTYKPTHHPTSEPTTPKPTRTHSETVKTTKKPTTYTSREPDLSYPTKGPTIASPTASSRPTRYTRYGSTTSAGAAGAAEDEAEIDVNEVGFQDSEQLQPQTKKTDFNSLYYVISALLISICYISGSLFCWVHYNHKYTSKVIELKRHSRLQSLQSPALYEADVVLQPNINPIHEPGAIANPDLLFVDHRNRLASSCASNVTAPTSRSNISRISQNIQEEEQPTVAPTSHRTPSSQFSEHTSEFKEVDYETAMGPGSEQERASIVQYQYGEKAKYGSKETHSVKESNLSDFNVVNASEMLVTPRYNTQPSHYIQEDEEFKEVDYETHNNQYQEDDEYQEEPIQPLKPGVYNNAYAYGHIRQNEVFQSSMLSPPIEVNNESIPITGSPFQVFIVGK